MNYENIYINLIDRAQNRKIDNYEKHHIIPKSIFKCG